MKIQRAIEVYRKKDELNIDELNIDMYVIALDADGILNILDDLILNEDDFPDEIYDPYTLTESQVKKLIPFLDKPLFIDFENNLYELSCYEVK